MFPLQLLETGVGKVNGRSKRSCQPKNVQSITLLENPFIFIIAQQFGLVLKVNDHNGTASTF